MGTEIRTFTSLKDISEFLVNQTSQYKSLFEDYSQWLGSVLRDAESKHKGEEWYQKSAAAQKILKTQAKKTPEADKSKKAGKGGKAKTKNHRGSNWRRSISLLNRDKQKCSFEAIEKISSKLQEYEKFKATVQQLTRLGLGQTETTSFTLKRKSPRR